MSSPSPSQDLARSSDDVQKEIHALMEATGGWLWGPTRERYEQLRDEWVEAMRRKLATAA
jgi:hypothetical protein